MTATLIDPTAAVGRLRPPHYLVIEKYTDWFASDSDSDDLPKAEIRIVMATDDEDRARENAEPESLFQDEQGVFDNWDGSWVVEPDWADECSIEPEGWTRYDLRPSADPAVTSLADDVERIVAAAAKYGIDRETVMAWNAEAFAGFKALLGSALDASEETSRTPEPAR